MIQFPKDFLWGAATSSHQVEGDNLHNDWWEWEQSGAVKELSGEACRHYQLYLQDFDLAKDLNHNAHRFSVEWSRIEPEPGRFNPQEIQHYQDVVAALRERNIEPVVTLHHFTNPVWFARQGGWQDKKSSDYFLRFVSKIAEALADKVTYWVTINEPMVYVYQAYILGVWPPQEKSFSKAKIARDNLAKAHIRAYEFIHRTYRGKKLPRPQVSIAKNVQYFSPCPPGLKNKIAAWIRGRSFNFEFVDILMRRKSLDFIGLNYYTRALVDVESWRFKNLILDVCRHNHSTLKKNSLGWDIFPEGLFHLLLRFKKYNLPLFILENGISTEDDNQRWSFICEHLKEIHRAMQQGAKVMGYIYWSLLDNFEWDKGFGHRFGLVEVDYRNYKRTIRESARKFSLVSQTGRLE